MLFRSADDARVTDPDADGIHCGFLVLLFFHRWMRPLLDAKRVAVVRPPWGEVVEKGELTLAFSEPELAALADALLQDYARHDALESLVIAPLESAQSARRAEIARKAAATRVDFFAMTNMRSTA